MPCIGRQSTLKGKEDKPGGNVGMRVGKKRLCSALQLPLTLWLHFLTVYGPSCFPFVLQQFKGNSASYRDTTHTVDFFKFCFILKISSRGGKFFIPRNLSKIFQDNSEPWGFHFYSFRSKHGLEHQTCSRTASCSQPYKTLFTILDKDT